MSQGFQIGDRIESRHDASRLGVCVYHLIDPRDGHVRYVGSTSEPYKRYCSHISEAFRVFHGGRFSRSRKDAWLRDLIGSGVDPVLEVVAVCEREQAVATELAEFNRLAAQGVDLLNSFTPKNGGRCGKFKQPATY